MFYKIKNYFNINDLNSNRAGLFGPFSCIYCLYDLMNYYEKYQNPLYYYPSVLLLLL